MLTSAAHILKLERYREDRHGLCARMTHKLKKHSPFPEKQDTESSVPRDPLAAGGRIRKTLIFACICITIYTKANNTCCLQGEWPCKLSYTFLLLNHVNASTILNKNLFPCPVSDIVPQALLQLNRVGQYSP